MSENMLDKIVLFDEEDKYWILLDSEDIIDPGIQKLCDAINYVDCFVTMNSCQGALYEDEKLNHCYKTYVDFYVLNHQYHVANKLFKILVSKFGDMLDCKLKFWPDYDYTDDDCANENGNVILRYSLEFVDINGWLKNGIKIMNEVINEIRYFGKLYKENKI